MTTIIARRRNADGHRIEWRDDGYICAIGRSSRRLSSAAAALVMSEICLYGDNEFAKACTAAKRAVEQDHLRPLAYFRAVMAGKQIKYGRSAWGHVAAVRVMAAVTPRGD